MKNFFWMAQFVKSNDSIAHLLVKVKQVQGTNL